MKIAFTKMQGAGNDFVVIDATRQPISLSADQWRHLADRRFGVGADQVLLVEASQEPGVDFVYRIFNADGGEVEQCGNGARCFVRFVHDRGLTTARTIRVRTRAGVIAPTLRDDGLVTVDMGQPGLSPESVGFHAAGLPSKTQAGLKRFQLEPPGGPACWIGLVSMGNPHAVKWVDDLDLYPVERIGPWIEGHDRFTLRVNAGFAQRLTQQSLRLRVYERGAGETLACGTGACAAVVAGVLEGLLDAGRPIEVQTRGGRLIIEWSGKASDPVLMTGPAEPVFEGVIEL